MQSEQANIIPLVEGNKTINTTCAYCGVGCGVQVVVDDENRRLVTIQGDEQHHANYGRLCSKGSSLGETLSLEGRLLTPRINGKPTSWPTAVDKVAQEFKRMIAKYGRESVAFMSQGKF